MARSNYRPSPARQAEADARREELLGKLTDGKAPGARINQASKQILEGLEKQAEKTVEPEAEPELEAVSEAEPDFELASWERSTSCRRST